MNAFLRGRQLSTVFQIAGSDENSATAALGWTLSKSRQFTNAFLSDVLDATVNSSQPRFEMQLHGDDRGFTDIEIRDGAFCHVIVEAKVGWVVPTKEQLAGYAPRIKAGTFRYEKLVSVSAMDRTFARLPSEIGGIEVVHRSWADVVRLIKRSRTKTSDRSEKQWLLELSEHLEGYMHQQQLLSSIVYVVALSRERISEKDPYTWADVVEGDRPRYFHPVGGRGFPNVPQNYIGFRLDGRLRSVHFVEDWEIVSDLSTLHPKWPATKDPHFIYTLGPPMHPRTEIRSGRIYAPGHHECAFDTLLSGRYATVAEAKAETDRRKKAMRLD